MNNIFNLEESRVERDRYLMQAFKILRLPGMALFYQEVIGENVKVENLDVPSLIEQFVDSELLRRKDRKTEKLIKEASLWYPYADLSEVQKNNSKFTIQQISNLSKCSFIEAKTFIIIYGSPKSGTTYLGCAIGSSACRLKYKTKYIRYFDLLQQLVEANTKGKLPEILNFYRKIPCLIVDDWLNSTIVEENELMLIREIMDYRPNSGGTILITHSLPDDWQQMIKIQTSFKFSLLDTLTKGANILPLE